MSNFLKTLKLLMKYNNHENVICLFCTKFNPNYIDLNHFFLEYIFLIIVKYCYNYKKIL